MSDEHFKLCSSCRAPIGFQQAYYACSVSTCNRQRVGLYFCSLPCWEAHLPMMRHRDAWAEERRAPTQAEHASAQAEEARTKQGTDKRPQGEGKARTAPSGALEQSHELTRGAHKDSSPDLTPMQREARLGVVRRGAESADMTSEPDQEPSDDDLPRDVLIVISKLKHYIKARSGFNTSDQVSQVLSDHVRRVCVEAIKNAARDGRKTVLDRDFLKAVR